MSDQLSSLLTVEAGKYLPEMHTINVYYMKQILAKKKRSIKIDQVRHLYVKQYEELTISKILEYAKDWPQVFEYLPDERDIHQLPRQVSDRP